MLGEVIAGLIYANVTEFLVHKHILHGWGKKKGSFWSFHWSEHHRNARKHDGADDSYHLKMTHPARWKEIAGIIGLMLTHVWLAPYFPFFVAVTWLYAVTYLWAHRKSHVDVEWGKKWMPWHRDHHLGRDQDKNWCVLFPWADWLMGTRVKPEPKD